MERLGRVVHVDAVFFATCDPSTLLFTDVIADDMLVRLTPLFLRNEFAQDDVNKFRAIATSAIPVNTLDLATKGRRQDSARYRDILQPVRLGDEMRVALRSGSLCWGFMCLHREDGTGFSQDEVTFMISMARPIADGLQAALLVARLSNPEPSQPGVLLVRDTLELEAASPAGEALLQELTGLPVGGALPVPVQAVAARLFARDRGRDGPPPTIRALSRANRWLVIHATHLVDRTGAGRTAVIIEPARSDEFVPLMLRAYRLSPREAQVTMLVLAGQSTKAISRRLLVTENSVQDHLKAVFEKVDVHSRRELTAYFQGQAPRRERHNDAETESAKFGLADHTRA